MTNWNSSMQRKIKWCEIWSDYANVRFLIRSVYEILPSPANLCIWNKTESALCPLCNGKGTFRHILSSCLTALAEGRYRWRHNQILKVIADIDCTASCTNKLIPENRMIQFIKAGRKPKKTVKTKPNILSPSTDWELRIDVITRLIFPEHVGKTSLRPDLILFSNKLKKIVMWELTVPWEEHLEEVHERKKLKYDDLQGQFWSNSWKASCLPIEVGARGFTARSLCKALSDMSVIGATKRRAIKAISDTAERTAKWLWIKMAMMKNECPHFVFRVTESCVCLNEGSFRGCVWKWKPETITSWCAEVYVCVWMYVSVYKKNIHMYTYVCVCVCLRNKHMYVSVCASSWSEWVKIFECLLNDLDYIFPLYLILEVYISFRRSYLIRILIYTGFNFYFICFLKPG